MIEKQKHGEWNGTERQGDRDKERDILYSKADRQVDRYTYAICCVCPEEDPVSSILDERSVVVVIFRWISSAASSRRCL